MAQSDYFGGAHIIASAEYSPTVAWANPNHYFELWLWDTQKSLRTANPWTSSNCIACHSPRDILAKKRPLPALVGELHFIAGRWNMELVTHELMHATMWFLQLFGPKDANHLFDLPWHERIAYMHGEFCDEVYSWLWEHDKPAKWEKAS